MSLPRLCGLYLHASCLYQMPRRVRNCGAVVRVQVPLENSGSGCRYCCLIRSSVVCEQRAGQGRARRGGVCVYVCVCECVCAALSFGVCVSFERSLCSLYRMSHSGSVSRNSRRLPTACGRGPHEATETREPLTVDAAPNLPARVGERFVSHCHTNGSRAVNKCGQQTDTPSATESSSHRAASSRKVELLATG